MESGLVKLQLLPFIDLGKAKYKYEIGQRILDEKKDIIIIDRRRNPITGKKEYLYKCNICGYDSKNSYYKGILKEYNWKSENDINNMRKCACCYDRAVKPGINDVMTTTPWMVQYFYNKEDAIKYTFASTALIEMKCPICKRLYIKRIVDLYEYKKLSCVCGDGISYPEKVMYCFLEYFNIPFIYHYKPKEWNVTFEYDFLILQNKYCSKTIIEVNGSQHYTPRRFGKMIQGRSVHEEIENDINKQNIAIQNGYTNITYNSIDCRMENNFEWIFNNIKSASFAQNLICNDFDKKEILKRSLNNIVKEICDYYNNFYKNGIYLKLGELSEKFHLCNSTISNYLHLGTKLGWCNYIGTNVNKRIANEIRKHIYVYDLSENFLGEFRNISYLAINSEKYFNKKLYIPTINAVLNHRRYSYKDLIFTYDKNYVHKKNEYDYSKKGKEIICLNSNYGYLTTYKSIKQAAFYTGISKKVISSSCMGRKSRFNNYIWMYKQDYDNYIKGDDNNRLRREKYTTVHPA